MSTPETQADADLRNAFEDARDEIIKAASELEQIREQWLAWREEFRRNMTE